MNDPTLQNRGSTGRCYKSSAAIDLAAEWLAGISRDHINRQIVPVLRERFGLSAAEACAAMRAAKLRRARAL